jgi:hypothetical protein
MTIYFTNKGHLCLDAIKTMGVSVKETDNPIGYFGTGFKYAIATLLRNDHKIVMETDNETYTFWSKPKEIRGQEFQIVMMNDEQLGFTTDLGKNWEIWQAFRELYANCLDEAGVISDKPYSADTVIAVTGEAITECYHQRGTIFLTGSPLEILNGVEIHRGRSKHIYYRGVRVGNLPVPSRFTYNITDKTKLTEDRTIAEMWDVEYLLGSRLPKSVNPEVCRKIIDPEFEKYEDALALSYCGRPSEEFLEELTKHISNVKLREDLRNVLGKNNKVTDIPKIEMTQAERQTMESAIKFLDDTMTIIVSPQIIDVVEHLGPNVMGTVRNGKILIPKQTIANGREYLAITLYEEWIHNTLGYGDCTRGMQQYLFDKILELMREREHAK